MNQATPEAQHTLQQILDGIEKASCVSDHSLVSETEDLQLISLIVYDIVTLGTTQGLL